MVIAIALLALFALFFVVRKHIGPAHLAVIAGLSVYEMFGQNLADILGKVIENVPADWILQGVYLVLVLAFPLILYLRSYNGGLYGILRFAEAAIFAALLTLLIAPALATFFSFDSLAGEIVTFIEGFRSWIVLIGVATAYFDILMYHE